MWPNLQVPRRRVGLLLCAALFALVVPSCGDPEGSANSAKADSLGVDSLAHLDSTDMQADDSVTQTDGKLADGSPAEPVCPGGSGCPCANNGACDVGICIDTPAGKRCAFPCATNCPAAFSCVQVSGPGGDLQNICVPSWGKICDPCTTSQACAAPGQGAAVCVVHGDAGAFCGSTCVADSDCPAGFSCQTLPSIEGAQAKQCAPKPTGTGGIGACTCSAAAVDAGLSTTCMVAAVDDKGAIIGKCPGLRTCAKGGLSACSAPSPATETCDGLDNNCNGKTDDGVCDDSKVCTEDTCDPKQGCQHAILDLQPCDDGNACTEGEACAGETCKGAKAKNCDDSNACTADACQPASGCLHKLDDGAPCDDGNLCTVGDQCGGGKCISGQPKACSNSQQCLTGKCSLQDGKCKFTNQQDGLACDDKTPCTVQDACAGGTCVGKIANCDDGNPCSDDGCDASLGCTHALTNGPCSDGNACTVGDACNSGFCKAGPGKPCDDGNACTADGCDALSGACAATPTTAPCDDGNACTANDSCAAGKCAAGIPLVCSDGNPCTQDLCDPASGACNFVPTAAPCDDGDACTVGDQCQNAKCAPGAAQACADTDTCTLDSCDKTTGDCLHKAISGCGGKCTAAGDCKDDNACTVDACLNGLCAFVPTTAKCEDGDACTLGDLCTGGACLPGTAKSCDDGNPCTVDSCAAGSCKHLPAEAPCEDGNPCTIQDQCVSGGCQSGKAKVCEDGNPCTADQCDAQSGSCVTTATSAACEDGNPCTLADACSKGSCLPGPTLACDDGNVCTSDACDPKSGGCLHVDSPSPCSDGSACTQGDSCVQGACKSGPAKSCDDNSPCTNDACDLQTGACSNAANVAPCSDDDGCTVGDLCAVGKCVPGAAKLCADADACTSDQCDPATGACTFKPIAGCGGNCVKVGDCDDGNPCTDNLCISSKCSFAANAAPCSDNNSCTLGDGCAGGACKSGTVKVCDDGNPCTADGCTAASGACTTTANLAACDDANPCTVGDQCAAGTCKSGKLLACSDGNPCTDDSCDVATGQCKSAANSAPCDDGDACSAGDQCAGGACKPGAAKNCDDSNPCTNDSCDPATGKCGNVANSAPCSDGNACTQGDVCTAAVCKPGAAKNCSDGKVCTDDGCDPATGSCLNSPNTAPCDDGNACTTSDACAAGVCKSGVAKKCDDGDGCTTDSCSAATGACVFSPIVGCGGNCAKVADCNDGNPCTTDACTAGKCAFPGNTAACDDGNGCTLSDVCVSGACKSGQPKTCDDGNPCTNDSCDPGTGGCVAVHNAASCADNNACTIGDVCVAGACKPGSAKDCSDSNPCTDDSCNLSTGACVSAANTAACTDNNQCTVGDKCGAGKCVAGAAPDCDDANVCTVDACNPASGCTHGPASLACDDGNKCTTGDACSASKCAGGPAPVCDDGNICTSDSCAPLTGCVATANSSACTDGNACTQNDTCAAGSCVPGAALTCNDSDSCTSDACDPGTGKCVYKPIIGCGGNCAAPSDCDDGNACTDNQCTTGKCNFAANTAPCSDNNACTLGDTCAAGACKAGTLKGCDDAKVCTNDACDPATGSCVYTPNTASCDDGAPCTVNDLCAGGKCAGTAYSCDDGKSCTTDACLGNGGCSNAVNSGTCLIGGSCWSVGQNNPANSCQACMSAQNSDWSSLNAGTACTDGNPCTVGEVCDGSAACKGANNLDADKDGFVAVSALGADGKTVFQCGGPDCNDGDATIKPGVADPHDGFTTEVQVVDAGGSRGGWVSAAVDSNSALHAVWYNESQKDWEYGTNASNLWQSMTIEATGDVGMYAAMAVDGAGKVHAVAYSVTDKDLHYVSNASGSWVVENATADTANDAGQWASMAVSADGVVHALYVDQTAKTVSYKKRVGGTWGAATALTAAGSWDYTNIAIDSKGKMHAAWHDVAQTGLQYASAPSGGSFAGATVVDLAGTTGDRCVLTLDGKDLPHIIYYDATLGNLKHARFDGAAWATGSADAYDTSGSPADFRYGAAVDAMGALHACFPAADSTGWHSRRISGAALPFGTSGNYSIEELSSAPSRAGWCSVVKGGDGRVHMVVASPGGGVADGNLMVTSTSSGAPGWRVVSGAGNQGQFPATAVGPDGATHVAWYDASNSSLRYAWRPAGGLWQPVKELDATSTVGQETSIAVSSANVVTIAYYDATNSNLKVISGSLGMFGAPAVVDGATSAVGKWTATAVDSAGKVAIGYYDDTNNDLKIATNKTGSWVVQTVSGASPAADVGQHTAVAFAGDGSLHVATLNATNNLLAYASGPVDATGKWVPGTWQTLDNLNSPGRWTKMAVDKAGNPVIAHQATGVGHLRVLTSTNKGAAGSWTSTTVSSVAQNQRMGLALDASGNRLVAFRASDTDSVRLASQTPGQVWTTTTVDPLPASEVSLSAGPTGDWHILYRDSSLTALREASNTWTSWTTPSIVLRDTTVGSAQTSTAIDANNVTHVVYYDNKNDSLKIARWLQGRWYRAHLPGDQQVAGDNSGDYADIAIGPDGVAHISYHDAGSNDLKYGRLLTNGAWQTETVDAGGSVGRYSSIAVGANGVVHIAYRDDTNNDLKYAVGGYKAWVLQKAVDSYGNVGVYASIAVDAQNQPHIACAYASSWDLHYLFQIGGAWQAVQQPETLNSVGYFASMALDGQGKAHIAHRDESANKVHYTTNVSGAWVTKAFTATTTNDGYYTSIALNPAGGAYIAYKDITNNDVMILTNVSGSWDSPYKIEWNNNVGDWMSLAQGKDKKLYAAYRDATLDVLKMAVVTINNNLDNNCDGY